MSNIEHWASIGAAALVKGGVVCEPVTGDVLYDHDWTPIEAARAVLEAVNYEGAVEARDELLAELRHHAELHGQRGYGGDAERAWTIWRRLGGQ